MPDRLDAGDSPATAVLSDAQIDCFLATGFLVVRGLFDAEDMHKISQWTDELADLPETPGRQMMYFEQSLADSNRRILSRIENFCPYHEGFNTLMAERRMRGCVSQLFAEPSVLFKDKINFKMPGADGFKTHQDVQAGWDAYADLHITALISIDASTPENGCLELAGGFHRKGLIGGKWLPMQDTDVRDMTFEPCETRPGDAVFFDSYTPHRSEPNKTNFPRRVLYITYNRLSEGDQRARYYADKRKNYPPDCERDPSKSYVFRV